MLIIGAMCLSLIACGVKSEPETESTDAVVDAVNEESTGPITITDQRGVTVEFDAVPTRIAATIMPFPSIFCAVAGSAEKLVGINPSAMMAYEDSTLKHVFPELASAQTSWVDTSFTVNIEELLLLEPDVVFQWTSQPEEIAKMEEVGLKVVALEYGDLEDLQTWIHIIGTLLGVEERAENLLKVFDENIEESDAILAQIPEEEYINTISLTGDMKVAGVGFQAYWFEHSGAINPARELSGDATTVDMEQIYEWNPEVIYIGNFTEIMPEDLFENTLDGQDWSSVAAVQNGQVYKIPIAGYRWDPPGVETPLMVKWMAKTHHSEYFADMDMREEITDFYKAIYEFDITDAMLDDILDDASKGIY